MGILNLTFLAMEGPAPSEVKWLSVVSSDPRLGPDQFDDEDTPNNPQNTGGVYRRGCWSAGCAQGKL